MEPLIFFLAIIAIVIGLIVSFHLKQKRREEWATVGFGLGLDYSHHDPFGLDRLPLSLFMKGDGRGCENVLSGRWKDLDVKAFDYWYYDVTTDSKGNRSKSYHRFTCILTEIPAACPHLQLSRESVFSRLADQVGFRDIEFESEEFNRTFQVKARDRKFATDLLDARMMQWLLWTRGEYAFEILDQWVLCYRGRIRPTGLHAMLGAVQGFHQNVPSVVWELYGTGAR